MAKARWWMCDGCRSLNDMPANKCYKCRSPRPASPTLLDDQYGQVGEASPRVGVSVDRSRVAELAARDPVESRKGGGVVDAFTAHDDLPVESARGAEGATPAPRPIREPVKRGISEIGAQDWRSSLPTVPVTPSGSPPGPPAPGGTSGPVPPPAGTPGPGIPPGPAVPPPGAALPPGASPLMGPSPALPTAPTPGWVPRPGSFPPPIPGLPMPARPTMQPPSGAPMPPSGSVPPPVAAPPRPGPWPPPPPAWPPPPGAPMTEPPPGSSQPPSSAPQPAPGPARPPGAEGDTTPI